jgi:hypothetical protein
MATYLSAQEKVLQEVRAQSDSRARVVTSRDGLPVTQLDADVTDMHQRGVPLTDVANHIIEHVADPEQAEIVAKLKPFARKCEDSFPMGSPIKRVSTYQAEDLSSTTRRMLRQLPSARWAMR